MLIYILAYCHVLPQCRRLAFTASEQRSIAMLLHSKQLHTVKAFTIPS